MNIHSRYRHSTATLMGMTKKKLVEYVRIAEHNQDVAEESLKQQAENVKDWIPVVRCRDCKYFKESDGVFYNGNDCKFMTKCIQPLDFCSYGERKDDGT